MKVSKYKATELGELSPITKGGEIVYSRLELIDDPNEPHNPWQVTYTPDAEEAVKVLQFLDEMNGIGWTPSLMKIEKDLRAALHDLMSVGVVGETDK